MSIQDISRKLVASGVRHVVVSSNSSLRKELKLLSVKLSILVKKIADTDYDNAYRIAKDIIDVNNSIEFTSRESEDAESKQYMAAAIEDAGILSKAIKNLGGIMADKRFKKLVAALLANPSKHVIATRLRSFAVESANIVISINEYYELKSKNVQASASKINIPGLDAWQHMGGSAPVCMRYILDIEGPSGCSGRFSIDYKSGGDVYRGESEATTRYTLQAVDLFRWYPQHPVLDTNGPVYFDGFFFVRDRTAAAEYTAKGALKALRKWCAETTNHGDFSEHS